MFMKGAGELGSYDKYLWWALRGEECEGCLETYYSCPVKVVIL